MSDLHADLEVCVRCLEGRRKQRAELVASKPFGYVEALVFVDSVIDKLLDSYAGIQRRIKAAEISG